MIHSQPDLVRTQQIETVLALFKAECALSYFMALTTLSVSLESSAVSIAVNSGLYSYYTCKLVIELYIRTVHTHIYIYIC